MRLLGPWSLGSHLRCLLGPFWVLRHNLVHPKRYRERNSTPGIFLGTIWVLVWAAGCHFGANLGSRGTFWCPFDALFRSRSHFWDPSTDADWPPLLSASVGVRQWSHFLTIFGQLFGRLGANLCPQMHNLLIAILLIVISQIAILLIAILLILLIAIPLIAISQIAILLIAIFWILINSKFYSYLSNK